MPRLNRCRITVVALVAILGFLVSTGPTEGNDGSSRCEGSKKQRKQKIEPRAIDVDQLRAMLTTYDEDRHAERRTMEDTALSRMEREYEQHLATGAEFVYDILVLSGGGSKGAFGSGFLEGWGSIPDGEFARPEFDMVTGVSTGALIAPFAFVGTSESYTTIVQFYENPEPNWVKKRGLLFFKPHHVSLFNDCHLQEMIRSAIDEPLVSSMAAASVDDRLLLVGATNLDAGKGRIFNVGLEAEAAKKDGIYDRIGTILIASAAIPGVFPPVIVDGMLYADGGATSNLFVTGFSAGEGPMARFRDRHPEAPLPKVRVWVVVNGKFQPEAAVTQPTWVAVAGRSLNTLVSSEEIFALSLIKDMVEVAETEHGADVEFRVVAIPEDAPAGKAHDLFDKAYMLELEKLGRTMGADPSSWRTDIPSAY